MKKVILFAAVVLAVGMSSCNGKCACVGSSTGDTTTADLRAERKEGGMSSASVCTDIKNGWKSQYPNALIECFEDKTLAEAEEAIKKRSEN